MIQRLLPLLIFTATTSFGQKAADIKQKAQVFQDSLIQNHVDTILDYTSECVGYYYLKDTCNYFDAHYIFWQKNHKVFLQRIDGCGKYKSISLDTINPLTFYLIHKKEIDKEIVYPPMYIQSKHGDSGTAISQSIDHTCYNIFSFLMKGKKLFKSASEYDLTLKKFDNGRKNMYYNYNQQTHLNKLIEQIKQLIKQMDTDKKFEVQ